MPADLLEGLNPQQREAVTVGSGPVLVLAGPGSGKTRVLTHRVAYLISEMNVYANHILSVTFTNKAAGEMRARIEKILGGRLDGFQIGTFHSVCARLLRIEAGLGVLPYSRDFVIYDTEDQLSVMKAVLVDLNIDVKKFNPGRVLNAISAAKNELIEPGTLVANDYFGEIARRAYGVYQKRLVESNAMDFDDLLMQTALLLKNNENVRQQYQERFRHILVDEFQDTNQAQYQLVQMLGEPQRNVFVVGDEDQGIYAFRGADYRNVMQFRRDYPEAKVILLEQNYRSTQMVLDAARAVIDKNQHRTPKALFTERSGGVKLTLHEAYSEREEGDFIVEMIRKRMKKEQYHFSDFAVMYRTNAQSRVLEDAFVKEGIPYKLIGGVGFYKRREIRDLLAYLRLVNNFNDDTAFTRIVNVPGRGIGDKSLQTFRNWLYQRNQSVEEGLEALAEGEVVPITGKAAKSFVEFARMMIDLREIAGQGNLLDLFDEIIARTSYTFYLNEISETTDQLNERRENIAELRGRVAENHDLSLSDFISDLALVSDTDTLDRNSDAVTLLTLHSAKGLEYPVVFLPGLEDGILPHTRSYDSPESMAEERRLLYVGITRAEDELYLSYAFRRTIFGESAPSMASRFLADIPNDLMEGVSLQVRQLQDREAYQRSVSWDRNGSYTWEKPKPATPRATYNPSANFGRTGAPAGPTKKYKQDMRVFHSKFGEGVVVDSRLVSGDEEVQVRFENYGLKVLSAAFAKLVIMD